MLMRGSILCPTYPPGQGGIWEKGLARGWGIWEKKLPPPPNFCPTPCQKLPKYAIFIRFVMFLGSNMAIIVKNSTLKRAAGENFAISCIKTVKNWLLH